MIFKRARLQRRGTGTGLCPRVIGFSIVESLAARRDSIAGRDAPPRHL
jgi:hypothetical protein